MSTYANQSEIWWPTPSALDDLQVEFEDTEDGGSLIHLSAEDGTECAEWLAYFQETPERQATFERELLKSLLQHAQRVIDGQSEGLTDQQSGTHPSGEEDLTGSVEEH